MITLKQLPTSVKLFVERCDAFIVGNAADPNATLGEGYNMLSANDVDVKDIDVVIPFHKWSTACIIIQETITNSKLCAPAPKLNAYGGMKFIDSHNPQQQITIDVWPSDLSKYLLSSLVEYIWNPKFNLRYVRCSDFNTGDKQ